MTMKTGEANENGEKKTTNSKEVDVQAQISELTKIILKQQKELENFKEQQSTTQGNFNPTDIAKLIAVYSAENTKANNIDFRAGIREEDIPKDDYDEKGTTFCAPFTGYCIVDDRRQGHRVVLPYNKDVIFFMYQGTRRFQQGKNEMMTAFATYTSHSKKEIEWLRNHSFFNIYFYESTKGAVSFDVQKAQVLARIMTTLSALELNQIIARCKEYNVPIDQDVMVMRSVLAMKMSDIQMESEQSSRQRRMMELEKEKELLMAKN